MGEERRALRTRPISELLKTTYKGVYVQHIWWDFDAFRRAQAVGTQAERPSSGTR